MSACCFSGPVAYAAGSVGGLHYEFLTVLPHQPDLDHNGIAEQLVLSYAKTANGGFSYLLEVQQEGSLLWYTTAATKPSGWNALFLTRVGEQDYLLDVDSKDLGNKQSYCYTLFTISGSGGRNFSARRHYLVEPVCGRVYTASGDLCEPREAANAVSLVNRYLANGCQLLNTDQTLLATFRKNGRMQDAPWWLQALDCEAESK